MHEPPAEDASARWAVCSWPGRMARKVDESIALMEEKRAAFFEAMLSEQRGFEAQVGQLKQTVAAFAQHDDLAKVESVFAAVADVEAAISEARARAVQFASREELFSVDERSDYELIDQIAKEFEPFASLWSSAHNWTRWHKSWLDGPLLDLEPDTVERAFGDAQKAMVRALKAFREQPGCLAIATQLKAEMDAFAPLVPLVKALRDRGMRGRHWDALSAELGIDLHPNETFTLRDATDGLKLHAPASLEVVERLCDKARKEYSIEKSLDEMQATWASFDFEVMPYRNTGTGARARRPRATFARGAALRCMRGVSLCTRSLASSVRTWLCAPLPPARHRQA